MKKYHLEILENDFLNEILLQYIHPHREFDEQRKFWFLVEKILGKEDKIKANWKHDSHI